MGLFAFFLRSLFYFGAVGQSEEVCVLWAGSAPAHSYPVATSFLSLPGQFFLHPVPVVSVLRPRGMLP